MCPMSGHESCLPVSRGLTKDEQERFEPVCWVYGDSIDRREMRREPAVVGLLEGTPIVVFNVYGYTLDSARNVEFQVPGAMIRVPFALIG